MSSPPIDPAAIRARHVLARAVYPSAEPWTVREICALCQRPWPCDAIRLLDYAEQQQAELERLRSLCVALEQECASWEYRADTASAHAQRLQDEVVCLRRGVLATPAEPLAVCTDQTLTPDDIAAGQRIAGERGWLTEEPQ